MNHFCRFDIIRLDEVFEIRLASLKISVTRIDLILCTVMSGRRPFGKGDFCFGDLRCFARGAVMSSDYDATSIWCRWP